MTVRDTFSSKWALILVCIGSTIGMGNIWLFPYRIGEMGGAFLIPYLICVALLGATALVGEMTFGRLMGSGPIGAYAKAVDYRGGKPIIGKLFGWFVVIGIMVVAVGYTIVIAWVARFGWGAVTGQAFRVADSMQYFNQVTGPNIMFWILLTLAIMVLTMFGGVEKGIERANKIMMPLFALLFAALAVRSAFLPNALEGYKYLLDIRLDILKESRTWVLALSQAFYSLSVFGSTMIVYGSYIKKSENILNSAKNIAILDTAASLLASIVIIPAVFAFGKDLNSGPPLLFITMTDVFKMIPFGQFFMIIFFVAIFFAGATSLISMLEVSVEILQTKFSRIIAVLITVAVVFIGDLYINGEIGPFMDIIELYFTPLFSLGAGIFIFWVLPTKYFSNELALGRQKPAGKFLIFMGRYVFCGMILIIYLFNIL
ncbi:MAG: sodium-dependent transporter [Elusimicrobiota bacterium]|nr:sodium-dependent transporter [Elusimicrobiota bacterium]